MSKKFFISFSIILIFIAINVWSLVNKNIVAKDPKIEGIVLSINESSITLRDSNHIIYTININATDVSIGDNILIEYTGELNKNKEVQDILVEKYSVLPVSEDKDNIPDSWQDDGIFSDYYTLAYNKLKTLTLDEKIGQLFLVRHPNENAINDLKKYNFGGFVFFSPDFTKKTKENVINMINNLQTNAKVPLLTSVDEEGGIVVRVSSNSLLSPYRFKSSQELYSLGGFSAIKEDIINKSKLLNSLGLNLNLAPVVDVSTNENDYMYTRSFGKNTELTSQYSKNVIEASKGTGVSYTLKHFPGYGNNVDTHTGSSIDTRTYENILNNDLPPFKVGIDAGAEAVLVSHNIVNSIDSNNPASLSISIHNLLRNELGFTGIVITDDLYMDAVSSIDDVAVKAILAGNDLIISTDYEKDIQDVKDAVNDGVISEDIIDRIAFRILSWKYYKGLIKN